MRTKIIFIVIGMCALLVSGFGVNTVWAQDLVKLRPDMYKVLLENDRVRVLEWTFKPGDKEPPHTHPEMVTYLLAGGKRQAYGADDKLLNERDMKAGQAFWSPPVKHWLVNTGTTEIKAIIVEIKTNPYKE
jgi:quercetin dioxygenase-like cupin family protein